MNQIAIPGQRKTSESKTVTPMRSTHATTSAVTNESAIKVRKELREGESLNQLRIQWGVVSGNV
jgi:hypothetical protein